MNLWHITFIYVNFVNFLNSWVNVCQYKTMTHLYPQSLILEILIYKKKNRNSNFLPVSLLCSYCTIIKVSEKRHDCLPSHLSHVVCHCYRHLRYEGFWEICLSEEGSM